MLINSLHRLQLSPAATCAADPKFAGGALILLLTKEERVVLMGWDWMMLELLGMINLFFRDFEL
jgi:hypothetical protein